MICHKYKCIFVEVPKTASSSVRAILGKAAAIEIQQDRARQQHLNLWQIKNQMETRWIDYYIGRTLEPRAASWGLANICGTAKTATRHGGRKNRILGSLYLLLPRERRSENGRKQFETYFKFGFVRNPWDRVVSLYERNEGLQLKDKMTFEQFVDWIKYSSSTCIHPSPHRYQLDWFVDPHGNLIADFIGRFERLEEDWTFVAQKLRITEKLPHIRNNPRARHYTEYYTSRTRDLIATRFKLDIEQFGYEFAG